MALSEAVAKYEIVMFYQVFDKPNPLINLMFLNTFSPYVGSRKRYNNKSGSCTHIFKAPPTYY